MFPFLAPIQKNGYTTRQGVVHITFMADSPHVSRTGSAASVVQPTTDEKEIQRVFDDAASIKSRSSDQNLSVASRPNSRAKSKNSFTSSQPTSARSEKSSPLPAIVKETIPPISRHKNKGLEMSSAMMELFSGAPGESAFGAGSSFKPVENHDAAYERAVKRARGQDLSKPGPEWYEGFEKLDMTDIELPPDPNCPAEKFIQEQRREYAGLSKDDDWSEAKRDVLEDERRKLENFQSLPGPDIGAGEEEEEEEEEQLAVASAAASESSTSQFQIDSPTGEQDDICDSPVASSPSSSKNGSSFGDGARKGDDADEQTTARERDAEDEDAEKNRNEEANKVENKAGSGTKSSGGGMVVLLIRNAQIINDDAIFVADVLVVDGVINNVGPNIEAPEGAEIIDASGKMLLPAGIDVHTRITAPDSADDLSVGCKSALAGGTATVVELVTPRNGESPSSAFKRIKTAVEKATCNVSISVVINSWNESIKSDMEKLVAEGVNSFVIDVEGDDKIFEIMEYSRKLGSHVRFFPTSQNSISFLEKKMLTLGVTGPEGYPQSHPETFENCRVNTICSLGQFANCPVSIISVSSGESMQAIEKSRANGALAHAEISSAAVVADASGYLNKDLKQAAAYLTDVPLRQGASDRLISALSSAPLAVCTSGHHAISSATRLAGKDFATMPKGTTGAEERLAVVWEKAVRNGRIDPMRFVAVTSSNAAKMFNLYPKKGKIAVGADADLVIWDGGAKRVLSSSDAQSSVDISLYDGVTVHSSVIATIVNGNIVWKNGSAVTGAPNAGFLALAPNSPYLFSMIGRRDEFGGVQKVERDGVKQNGASPPVKKMSGDFDRDRNRKHTMESNIDFGGGASRAPRNPPGGRTTGFW